MKIAFVGQKGIPAKFGGVERHVEGLATEMSKQGNDVFVYSRKNYSKKVKKYKGITLIFIPSINTKHLDAISHTFFSIIHILFHRYDVVHFQSIGPASLLWIVKLLKRKSILVSTFHCQDYYHQKWGWFARKFLMFGEWASCAIPDITIVTSKILQKYVKDKYNRKSIYITNGSTVHFDKQHDKLSQWALSPGKYILSVGRLIRHKNIHDLIYAFIELKDNNEIDFEYKLAIVGDGYYTDNYVKKIKNMSKGRQDIVLTGNQSGKSLRQLFSNAKLFVQPSSSEGLSLVILEALGYNLPTLVSDIPENKEAIRDGGVLFKLGDIADLKYKIKKIIRETEAEKTIYQEKAEKLVRTVYNWEIITKKTLTIYDKYKRNLK